MRLYSLLAVDCFSKIILICTPIGMCTVQLAFSMAHTLYIFRENASDIVSIILLLICFVYIKVTMEKQTGDEAWGVVSVYVNESG